MRANTLADAPNEWGVALFRSLRATEPRSATEQAAFAKYLDERSDREDARADRTHGAEGVIPVPLWIVLFLSATILLGFMLFFADSGEPVVVQAMMMGGVAILVTSLLLLLCVPRQPVCARLGQHHAGRHGAHARPAGGRGADRRRGRRALRPPRLR